MKSHVEKLNFSINVEQLREYYKILQRDYPDYVWNVADLLVNDEYTATRVKASLPNYGWAITTDVLDESSKSNTPWPEIKSDFDYTEKTIKPERKTPLFFGIVEKILDQIPYACRLTISVFPPTGATIPHKDQDFLLRVHIPIYTNKDVGWLTDTGYHKLDKPGQAYLCDTRKMHAAYNDSKDDRVHLIFAIEDRYLEDLRKIKGTIEIKGLDRASQIQTFYSKIKFPGLYDLDDLNFYQESIDNKFLSVYNTGIQGSKRILDIGCGTGFITNLLAIKNPGIAIDAVDFSDSIDFAHQFSVNNNINNVTYYKEDFFKFVPTYQYDCIICNGVLHHMPQYKDAIDKIKTMITPSGKLILGVYNYYGKSLKKLLPIKYRCELLRMDQEDVPYEINFTNREFLNYFKEFKVNTIYPSINNRLVDIKNLINYTNGGLTVYNLTREDV